MNTKLKLRHVRSINQDGVIRNRGGATVSAEVNADTGEVVKFFVAYCSPRDNFNRAYGKIKATNRMQPNHLKMSWDEILVQTRRAVDEQLDIERQRIVSKYETKLAHILAKLNG